MKHECGETRGGLEPVYDLFPSEFTLPVAVTQACCIFVERVVFFLVFFFCESLWTPPLEGTSLHR